jgi:ribose transport system substrate-binding protein
MKRLFTGILAALLVFIFVGISGAWEPNEKGYLGAPRPFLWSPVVNKMVDTMKYKKKPPYTIGFCNTSISNIWRVALLHEIQYYASLHKDLIKKLIITDANDDPTKQIADMQSLIQRGVDILLVSAGQSAAMDPVVTRAMKKGIPVVMVDRRVTSDNFVSFVYASDLTIGRWMAQWTAETLNYKGNVVLLAGMAGASPAEERIRGAKEVYMQYPGIKILDVQYSDWSPAKGKKITAAWIQKYGKKIDAVTSLHGLQGWGAVEAYLEAGWDPKDIPLQTGSDLNGQLQLCYKNKIPLFIIHFPPIQGGAALETCLDVLQGKTVPFMRSVKNNLIVTKGYETKSVRADKYVYQEVKMEGAGDLILSVDFPFPYDAHNFNVDYPK